MLVSIKMNFRLVTLVVIVLALASISSVYAQAYGATAPSFTTGTAGISVSAGGGVTVGVGLTYPNGKPATLTGITTTLTVCGTGGCQTVTATITSSGNGQYSFSYTQPSGISGACTVTVPAGSLTDTNGNSFPAVNTEIGSYTVGAPAPNASPAPLPNSNSPVRVAKGASSVPEQAPAVSNNLVVAVVAILIASAGFLLFTRRRPTQ